MAGLTTIGYEIVAAGVEAFKQAGTFVAEAVAHINESFNQTPQAIQKFSRGTTAMEGDLQHLRDELKDTQDAFLAGILGGNVDTKALVKLQGEMGRLSQGIRILEQDEKELDKAFADNQRSAANLAEALGTQFTNAGRTATGSIQQIQERIEQLEKSLDRLRSLQAINIISTGAIDPNIASGISEATKQLTQLQQAQQINLNKGLIGFFTELGTAVQSNGPAIASMVSSLLSFVAVSTAVVSAAAAIAGGLAAIVVNAGLIKSIEFASGIQKETQFAKAVLQATDEEINTLTDSAEKLSSQFPISFRAVIESLTEAGRAGINLDQLNEHVGELIESLTILGKGEIGPRAIAEALAASLVAFKNVGGTADDFAKSVLGVANATRLSIPEVVSGFNKLAPVASLLKLTEEQTAAFIGIVGAAGLRGEEAGTGLRNFFLKLANPSKEATVELQKFGISMFDATGSARPLGDVLKDLEDKFGNGAIAAGKMDDRTRLFVLSQIFQTRSATAAALAIVQGTEAYQAMLDVIENTDPIKQSAVAIDNLQDKLTLIKNKVSIAVNAFGQELLPGVKQVADQIDAALSNAINPDGKIRQNITTIGKAINSLVSGQNVGQTQASVGATFGDDAEKFFANASDQAAKFRAEMTDRVIPAVADLANAISKLVIDTVFNTSTPERFGDALTNIVGIVVGIINSFTLLVGMIDTNRDAILKFGEAGVQALGSVFSAVGTLVHSFAEFQVAMGQFFQQLPQSPKPWWIDSNEWDKLSEGRTQFQKFGDSLVSSGNNILQLGAEANTGNDKLKALLSGLDDANKRRETVAALTKDINTLTEALQTAQAGQLQAEGPDRTKEITDLQALIATLMATRESIDDMGKTQASANNIADQANALYRKVQDAFKGTTADTTSLSEALKEQQRVEAAIKAETEGLTRSYEEMSRSASKAVREVGDKLTDLSDRTNREMSKLAQDLQTRLREIQTNLEQANASAVDSFNFNKFVAEETKFINRMSQDINTSISRNFRTVNLELSHSIEDRETGRQHDLELEQRHQQRIVDTNLEAHQRITEDLERSLQNADEDRQRSFQRQQELQIQQLQRQFDVQNLARNRTLDDAERQKQLTRDLSKATSAEDRTRIQQQFQDDTQRLKDTRGREDNENKIRLQQEDQLTKKRHDNEDESVAQTRRTALAELSIRRNLADAEKDYREGVELEFLRWRWGQEVDFRAKTRQLDVQDQTARDRITDQQTQAERDAADLRVQPLQDAITLQQFLHEQQNRQNEADKQSATAVENAQTKSGEMMQTFTDNQDRIIRDGLQSINDIGDRANQIATDALRKVGGTFPALGNFTGGIAGLLESGRAGVNGASGGQINIPDFQGVAGGVPKANLATPNVSPDVLAALSLLDNRFGPPPAGTQVTPALLSTAATLKAAQSTIQLNQSVERLLNLLETQAKAGSLGGVTMNVDDLQNNGVIIDSGTGDALARVASGIGSALASSIRPKGGTP